MYNRNNNSLMYNKVKYEQIQFMVQTSLILLAYLGHIFFVRL